MKRIIHPSYSDHVKGVSTQEPCRGLTVWKICSEGTIISKGMYKKTHPIEACLVYTTVTPPKKLCDRDLGKGLPNKTTHKKSTVSLESATKPWVLQLLFLPLLSLLTATGGSNGEGCCHRRYASHIWAISWSVELLVIKVIQEMNNSPFMFQEYSRQDKEMRISFEPSRTSGDLGKVLLPRFHLGMMCLPHGPHKNGWTFFFLADIGAF